ncbi:MAG TPA: outer membrane beta-barrel protein [Kofleriaceae bacterium]|nr:outer membrane beta-barrel protein [Kofleriaceae bacterium]
MRTTLALATLTVVTTPALADTAGEPTPAVHAKTLGVDGAIAMPTGAWGDASGVGIGALGRFEYALQPKLAITARLGFVQHLSKEVDLGFGTADSSTSEIPVFGGVRYAFSQSATSSIYGAAELGFVVYRVSLDSDGMSKTGSDTNLGMSLGAGYRTGKLDLRGALFFPDAGEVDDAMAVMATVGYDLTAL